MFKKKEYPERLDHTTYWILHGLVMRELNMLRKKPQGKTVGEIEYFFQLILQYETALAKLGRLI